MSQELRTESMRREERGGGGGGREGGRRKMLSCPSISVFRVKEWYPNYKPVF